MRKASGARIVLSLVMAFALFFAAGYLVWYQEPVDWKWPFAVYILYALSLVDNMGRTS